MFNSKITSKLVSKTKGSVAKSHLSLECETLEPRMMLSSVQLIGAGSEGTEEMRLLVDDVAVATYALNDGAATGQFQTFTYDSDATIIADQIKVEFFNADYDPANGIDENVRLDAIVIDGVRFETEDPSVFSTGTWKPEDGITPGFRESEFIHANGYLQFAGGGVDPPSTGPVVINEIHYNPADALDGDAEFLELFNPGETAVDLSGMSFTGFDLTFVAGTTLGAGQYAIVSPSIAIAEATWGVTPIAEFAAGGLSGGGEVIQLLAADGITVVDEVTYSDATPWTGAPDGNGPSLELKNPTFDNSLAESWGASEGDPTPGAQNSIFGDVAGDPVTDITVTPGTPLPNTAFSVTATIVDATTATLTYKVGFGEDVTVNMVNTGGDVWSATIPGQDEGSLVRYRIDSDVGGGPTTGDTINYLGVVVENAITNNDLPVFQFFVDEAQFTELTTNVELALTNTKIPAVVFYDGQVIDNATVRVRGGDFSRANYPKKSLKFELPDGYTLDFGTGYGVDEFAINADYSDWTFASTDIAWDVWNTESQSQAQSFNVRVQNNGDFHGVFRFQELYDGAWRDANGFADDEFYKAGGGGFGLTPNFDKKSPDDDDFSSISEINDVLYLTADGSEAKNAWLYENVNVPAVINHMALSAMTRHDDQDVQNFYMARDAESGLWEMIEWDLDRLWTVNEDTETAFTDVSYIDEPLMNAIFAVPEFEAMYWRRMQTLADTYLSEDGRATLLARRDELIAEIGATNSTLEFEKWGRVDIFTSEYFRNEFINDLQKRADAFAAETRMSGSASGNTPIVISELHYNPAGDDAEFIELFNNSNESIDLSGWQIDGIGLDVIEFGTVILPGQYMVFTDNMPQFRTQYPDNIFVGGQYSGGLSGGGETVTLLDAAGNTVDVVTYSDSDPWPTAPDGNGNTLALIDVNADNDVASNWAASSQVNGTPGLENSAVVNTTTVTVFAAGRLGDEQISLDIAGNQVAIYDLSLAGGQAGDLEARNFTTFTFITSDDVTPADVRINFLNDSFDPVTGIGRDIAIDKIEIDGVAYETENSSVFSTGSYVNGVLTPGFLETEILDTNGYFQYAEPIVTNPNLVRVLAAGQTGNEIITLEIAGTVVATYDLAALGGQAGDLQAGNFIELTYESPVPVDASDVRINFINDFYDHANGIDYNVAIDYLRIGDSIFETEAPTTYSTGTWRPDVGVEPGFVESEILTSTGYFQYLFDPTANNNPSAVSDTFSTQANTSVSGNLLVNDSDPDVGDTFTVASNTTPSNGTVSVAANGDFTYTPSADFSGTDTFIYTIVDSNGGSNSATVTITVVPVVVNQPPVAGDDNFTTEFQTTLTGNLFINDSDPDDGDVLSLRLNNNVSNGTLSVQNNGDFTYTPNAGFSGTDTFFYSVQDQNGEWDNADVTITVEANVSPIANGNTVRLNNVQYNSNLAIYSFNEAITSTTTSSQSAWQLIDSDGDGRFYLRNVSNGRYLDGDFSGVDTSNSSFGTDKLWEFVEISSGQYHLVNVAYNRILDANGSFAYVGWDPPPTEADDLWTVTVL